MRPASILVDSRITAPREESVTGDMQLAVARVIAALRRRRWLFIFAALSGVMGGLIVGLFLPRSYQLSAIFERRDDVVITKLVAENSPYSFATLRQSLNIDLSGYNSLSDAVDQLGLTKDFPHDAAGELTTEGRVRKQNLVNLLGRQTEVSLLEKSNFLDLIEVRYKGEDPALGVRLVTQLKDNYIKHTRTWISDIVSKARDFFQQEVTRRSEQVARMEAEQIDETAKHPGVDPGDPELLRDKILKETTSLEELSRHRAEVQSDINAREEYLKQLNGGPGHLPTSRPADLGLANFQSAPSGRPNPQYQRIAKQIEELEAELADAKTLKKMTDQHPKVVALNEKLHQLEAQLANLPETLAAESPAPAAAAAPAAPSDPLAAERGRLNMELKSLRETLARLDTDIPPHQAEKARLEQEKEGLFERRQRFVMRQQELQTAKNDLSAWNSHLETISRVMTAEAEDRGMRFATVEDAREPYKPSSPTLNGVLMLSFGVGLALGVAAVFVRELLDRSFRTAARVRETLGIPVLEAIGNIGVDPPSRWSRLKRLVPVAASMQGLVVLGLCGLVYLSVERPATFDKLAGRVTAMIGRS